ncbi:hypothetical protein TNCV_4205961 [Trichonephila clavipes]|nr:hypothetical protein TNCV_4205961 [Trichonephila clavipes]
MPLCHFRRLYEQLLQFERERIICMIEAEWSARRVAHQLRPLWLCCEEVLRSADPRDVIYTKTRLRTSSTDQSSRRPPHCTWLKDIWDCGAHYMCCPGCPSINASVWSGAAHKETGLQQNGTRSSLATQKSRFNLSSDDNCVRVWRLRNERPNPAFALQ